MAATTFFYGLGRVLGYAARNVPWATGVAFMAVGLSAGVRVVACGRKAEGRVKANSAVPLLRIPVLP